MAAAICSCSVRTDLFSGSTRYPSTVRPTLVVA